MKLKSEVERLRILIRRNESPLLLGEGLGMKSFHFTAIAGHVKPILKNLQPYQTNLWLVQKVEYVVLGFGWLHAMHLAKA